MSSLVISFKIKERGAKPDFNSCLHLVFIYISKERETSGEKKRLVKVYFTDSCCEKCSLQFDKRSIFKMHLSIVHKEIADVKEKSICRTLKEETDETSRDIHIECSKQFK